MLTRRSFFAYTTAGTLTLFTVDAAGNTTALAAIPGGSLDAAALPKFVTPLVVPPVMPRSDVIKRKGGKNADLYQVSMRQFTQQVLPVGLPTTTVWGYGPADREFRGRAHHAPSYTIEAQYGRPVQVRWINDLVDVGGNYLPHLLPVDPTLHWANPERRPAVPGQPGTTDTRPSFEGLTYTTGTPGPGQYGRYTGPVPLVTHVHGAMRVGDESDGYPEAWYLPRATNIPAGYARTGRWWSFFAAKAKRLWGGEWTPGSSVSEYPNANRASTMWYHDHTLGMTRLNVYAGGAGFYIVRGGPGGDRAVLDDRTGTPAALPGPAPRSGDRANKSYREIPLAIQDRSFNADGSLFYPDSRAFFDGYDGEVVPATEVSPLWNPEFFGNAIIVNGRTWPSLTVEQVRYRFRVLNGCQGRFLILDFGGIPGIQVSVIGNDGGFLTAPHDVMAAGGRVVLAPAQRLDVLVDFAQVPVGNHVLANVGPDEPFGGGEPGVDFEPADPATTGLVMQFAVVPATAVDPSTPAANLVLPAVPALPATTVTRRLALMEHMHGTGDEDRPVAALLGHVMDDPDGSGRLMAHHAMWMDEVSENPAPGATEVWEIYNLTVDAHPIHVHETTFEVIDRQGIVRDETGMFTADPAAAPVAPGPTETGFLDTVIAEPGQVTRFRLTFGTVGQYVWHCHIVEHEDNEMMRPYRIGAAQPGQPA